MAPTRASRPAAAPFDPRAGYAQLDYRRHYAELLRRHPHPPVALAELCLFRFWLTSCAYRHVHERPGSTTTRMPLRHWPLPREVAGHDIEATLGDWIGAVVESRFDLYERFFHLGRNDQDPLGLDAATLALSCQLFALTPPPVLGRLQAETREQFAALVQACAGG